MDLEFDARYDEFRAKVREFLAKHEPPRPFGMTEGKREDRIAWLSLLIEPAMLVVMGILVGIIAISFIVPIFRLSRAVG